MSVFVSIFTPVFRSAVATRPRTQRLILCAAQLGLVIASNWLAFALRFDGNIPDWALQAFANTIGWLVAVRAATFVPFGLYRRMWRYTSVYDLNAMAQAIAVSSLAFAALAYSPFGPEVYPRSILIIDALLLLTALSALRVGRRLQAGFANRLPGRRRLLIVGAGDAGELFVQKVLTKRDYQYQPIGFVDDDTAKVGRSIHGVRVLGTRADLERIVAEHRVDEVLIAIPSADASVLRTIVRALEPCTLPIKTLPRLRDILDGKSEVRDIRTLRVDDLLARAPIGLDPEPLRKLIAGRRVLVTGAGGSIGSELCRQIAAMRPDSLIMLDRYENGLHAVYLELQDRHGDGPLRSVITDITDAPGVDAVFAYHRPEIVFHAAAHKHVPLMEANPCEAIKNNVTGTRILADAASRYGVERFILISTDKAVNPSSVMGSSKRVAELLIRSRARESRTIFAAVRFGNVLGSNGSVLPRFLEQIKQGGPVTVTHPDMRRFFMLTTEAVQLVLHAAAQAEQAAVYVLEMGEQVKLVEMARHLIRLSGFVPNEEIPIEFIGLRPGEKLEEELVGDTETVRLSGVEKILCVTDKCSPSAQALAAIGMLEKIAAQSDTHRVRALLKQVVTASPEAAPAAMAAAVVEALKVPRGVPVSTVGRRRVAQRPLPALTRDERVAGTVAAMSPFVPDRSFSPRNLS